MQLSTRQKALLGGALLLVPVGTFLGGRYTATPQVRVETKVQVVEKEVIKTVTVESSSDKKDLDSNTNKHTHRETTTVAHKDGTTETKTVEDTNVDRVVHEVEVKYVDRYVDRVEYKDRVVKETQVVAPAQKNWIVGPMVGVNAASILSPPPAFVFGAHVERRIAGPFFLGAYGLSSGQAGLSLSLEF
jgi:hypothetical protein